MTATSPPLVRAASLTHYAAIAAEAGLDARRLLADAGLGASVLSEPDLMVPAERVSKSSIRVGEGKSIKYKIVTKKSKMECI